MPIRPLLLAAVATLAPALAHAQLTIYETHDSDSTINIAECKGTTADGLTFSWTVTAAQTDGTYHLLVSDTYDCPTSSSSDARTVSLTSDAVTGTTGSYPSSGSVSVSPLLLSLGISCSGAATTLYACLVYTPPSSSTTSATTTVHGGVNIDLTVPPAPVASTPQPGDGALHVSWTDGAADSTTEGTAAKWRIVITSETDATDAHEASTADSSAIRVGGLTNGVTYDVVVYALTASGNSSVASNVVTGTPEPVDDFWDLYRNAGGVEAGGCAAAGAPPLAGLGLLGLARRRRRSP